MNAHTPCPPFSTCVPCPHPPILPNQSGPDVPGVACWIPQNCCMPSPCAVSLSDFICAIRSLLPEGDIYNNTKIAYRDPPTDVGVINVGCAKVGCEQLVLGGCCNDRIDCDDNPIAPQLAVVDSYAAAAYSVVQALCKMLRELDPCTSNALRRQWAKRLGLLTDDLCAPQWSDEVLAQLLCILPTLKNKVWNWELLQRVAARFGADITLRPAGDFSDCAPAGWWTMARDRNDCPPAPACPPEAYVHPPPWIRTAACEGMPESYNLILCPANIRLDDNCNLQPPQTVLPHDPELYAAFKWLLPKILPQPVFWCVYQCDADNCIQ